MGRQVDPFQVRQPAKHLYTSLEPGDCVRIKVHENDAPTPKFAEAAAVATEMFLSNLDLKAGKYVYDALKLGGCVHGKVFLQAVKPVVPITSISIWNQTTVAQDA